MGEVGLLELECDDTAVVVESALDVQVQVHTVLACLYPGVDLWCRQDGDGWLVRLLETGPAGTVVVEERRGPAWLPLCVELAHHPR